MLEITSLEVAPRMIFDGMRCRCIGINPKLYDEWCIVVGPPLPASAGAAAGKVLVEMLNKNIHYLTRHRLFLPLNLRIGIPSLN